MRDALAAGAECLAVDVSDRFGSYGLTGVAIFRAAAGALAVDTFLLSCRALGRGVEHRMLAALGEIARSAALDAVEVPFVPAQRNRPALLFLESVGARFEQARPRAAAVPFPGRRRRRCGLQAGAPAARPAAAAPRAGARARRSRSITRASPTSCAARKPCCARLPNGARVGRRLPALHRRRAPSSSASWPPSGKSCWACPPSASTTTSSTSAATRCWPCNCSRACGSEFGVDLSLEVVYGGDFTIAELARRWS